MILFFIFFFTLYGGMHLYAFLKLRNTLSLSTVTSIIIAIFLFLMTFAPLLIRLSEKQGFEGFATALSWTGYMWMALLFLFFSFSVTADFALLILKRFIPSIEGPKPVVFYVSLFISIALTLYGYMDALNIRTEKVEIQSNKIKRPVRIVQISDVHIGLIVRKERLERIINKIKEAKPDILVSTGDLVDGQIDRLDGISELLRNINPPFGKYAITGNHEFYAGLRQALSFTEKSGFTVLRGEAVYIPELNLTISGVDDPAGKRFGLYRDVDEVKLLSGLKEESFILLLKHRPIVNSQSRGLFDLQLSGHTHKGQIFPFNLLTGIYYPADSGCLNDVNGCYLYVSRGTGTWGPPVRVFAPPEITVIEIKN